MQQFIKAILLFSLCSSCVARDTGCLPEIDSHKAQYIIGYGSLINAKSRQATDPTAGEGYPVWVKHYQRGWFARGDSMGRGLTFLGVKYNPNSRMNAVVYRVLSENIKKYDAREAFYCRVLVTPEEMSSMTQTPLPNGQTWIYVPQPENNRLASSNYPLVSSYVDIFLSGCLQVEAQYHTEGFAAECIKMTSNWSSYWENDRIYPRRPWQYQPDAMKIDNLLSNYLPAIYKKIKLPKYA